MTADTNGKSGIRKEQSDVDKVYDPTGRRRLVIAATKNSAYCPGSAKDPIAAAVHSVMGQFGISDEAEFGGISAAGGILYSLYRNLEQGWEPSYTKEAIMQSLVDGLAQLGDRRPGVKPSPILFRTLTTADVTGSYFEPGPDWAKEETILGIFDLIKLIEELMTAEASLHDTAVKEAQATNNINEYCPSVRAYQYLKMTLGTIIAIVRARVGNSADQVLDEMQKNAKQRHQADLEINKRLKDQAKPAG